jgi:hypothetical protein
VRTLLLHQLFPHDQNQVDVKRHEL